MRKLIGMMIVMFICFVLSAGSAFAWPPVDKASKNQACNASDEGKMNANENSVLDSCGNDDPPAPDEQVVEEEEESTTTASTDDTNTVDCTDPAYFATEQCM